MIPHSKYLFLFACTFVLASLQYRSVLSDRSSSESWINLFNGKNLDGWIAKLHHHPVGVNFGNTFRAEDGIIKVRYDQYGATFDDQFGHLFYRTPFSHFHLKLEYRFVGELYPGAPSYTLLNSGVMFHSQDPHKMPVEQNWPISVEMQFLAGLGDGQPRPTGNMCSPGTHVVFRGELTEEHCIESSSRTYPKEEWVSAELVVHGNESIKHIINGDTVLRYSQPQIGGEVVERFDPREKKDGQKLNSGFIALQSEGQPIDFRNIVLKKIK